ncbi:acetyltransferase, GNAT family protein [Trichomonas vaginalis G3]|uniref:Acetyltransferase, GNAT family protein n=1 Tax=Trichomonas vaginalis (strain ATCC PRA-98 / G3) TaxID=412133 RepID=A2FN75_TRIV3|nr:Acyl-CoA N-acyltransferases (Nat) family [Trichomonas vaginalis G3]EAX93634.1 acetyltransferase, GNAT family protein [Trichomonas vaginalis G3]KAI5507098.1 Acyl-CoA N-acyltransferases (Nat) family [Trichomonas vaginalis G3]|eukprot:XP_001306564.1 acetyltransferase, GNAT family protein [Trichomonas vaginalis G3]
MSRTTNYQFHKIGEDSKNDIAFIMKQSFPECEDPYSFYHPKGYIAYANDVPVGVASFHTYKAGYHSCIPTFSFEICVIPKYRHHGIGKQLYQYIANEIKDEEQIITTIQAGNSLTFSFFERRGFTKAEMSRSQKPGVGNTWLLYKPGKSPRHMYYYSGEDECWR